MLGIESLVQESVESELWCRDVSWLHVKLDWQL